MISNTAAGLLVIGCSSLAALLMLVAAWLRVDWWGALVRGAEVFSGWLAWPLAWALKRLGL